MADSRGSAGGVAPSSLFVRRFRPSRITPYDLPGLHRSTQYGLPPRRSTQYGPPAIAPSEVPSNRSTQYIAPSEVPSYRSTQYIAPSEVPSYRSTQYGPPAIAPSEVPSYRSTQYIAPSEVPSYRSTQYGLPPRRSTQYGPPAIAPSEFPSCRRTQWISLRPAMVSANTPYDPANPRLSAIIRRCAPYDPPAIGYIPSPDPFYKSPDNIVETMADNIGCKCGHCALCGEIGTHSTVCCPFLTLAAQLDVVKDNPPIKWKFYMHAPREGTDGYGFGCYDHPKVGAVEKSAADAMRLYKSGLNLIRMIGLPENNRDPKQLCSQLEKKIGPVAHVTVFPDQSFGFVKFVSRDSAKKAIEVLNYSDCGHLTWAMQRL